jgi:hypothetical protein
MRRHGLPHQASGTYIAQIDAMNVLSVYLVVAAVAGLLTGTPALHADYGPASATATPLVTEIPPTAAQRLAREPNDVGRDAIEATRILSGLKKRYRLLDHVSVTMGDTPKGEQAVAYYATGEIVIDPEHTAPLDVILAHEVWHVIDWRDNGRIDWGEVLPPTNSSAYLR